MRIEEMPARGIVAHQELRKAPKQKMKPHGRTFRKKPFNHYRTYWQYF